ncbi:hypothetical protein [Actinocorallia populi]|uniref:hypothetical protein n=1 Tax=Actinocorallia populi TaxID=2079200 RepID=UPI000D090F75|nr:hypothetical protein [Actinocorallia populi]
MKRLVAAALAGVLSSSLLADPASAGLRALEPAKTFRLAGDETVTSAVAPSRRSAFVFAMREHRGGIRPLAFRWNGETWRRSPLPGGVKGIPGQADASSARNVWMTVTGNEGLFDKYRDSAPSGICPAERRTSPVPDLTTARAGATPSKVLRWNGRRWTVVRTFKNAYVNEVVARGPRDVQVYGIDRKGPASWHFDGRTWRRHAMPFLVLKAESSSGGDVWALALDRSRPGVALARSGGAGWTRVRPDVPPAGPARTRATPIRPITILDLGVLGRDDVRVSAITGEGGSCSSGEASLTQLHWNGATWTGEAPASIQNFFLSGHASDGAGGFYAYASGSDSGDEWDFDHALFHRSAKGVWSRRILSEKNNVQQLVHIPGTRSLWAAGTREGSRGLNVAVWSLGRP